MSDLIDRQAAIDSIMEEPSEARYPVFYAEKIRQLPSEQLSPCAFCKYNDTSAEVVCLMCPAERRTDE